MSPQFIAFCLIFGGWCAGLACGVWLSNRLWPVEAPEPAYKRVLDETYGGRR